MSQSNVKLFEKEEFGKVRVVMQGEDPWFMASDVAKALGYEKPNNAVNEHCKKMNKITLDPNLGGRVATVSTPPIQAIIIPESDVYRLVMRSNLPRAVEFQDWICEEVIPSIRKHGLYATEEVVDRILDDPDFGITLLQRYKFEREQRQLAEAQRDEAIRTKAEIGSRREATAMATASAAVRKAAALENELGRGRDYKSVKGIPWFLDVFADTPAAYSVAGRKLSDMSRRMDYEIREVEDTRYGIVKAYHVDVIEAFRLALKNDLNMMRKYRLRRAA